MTHILIPREPSTALLRPFIGCNTQELHEAWAAMVRIAEVQHARAGSQCLQQIEEGPQSVDIAINHGTEDLAMHPLSTAPAALAGPAWDKTRDSLAALLLGLARRPFLDFDVACIALDAATGPGMPLAYMRAAQAAPALEAPAAPADGATPGPWFVRKREVNGELRDCFVAAPDCQGLAYDACILCDDEYHDGVGRKLADCELIVAAVNQHRAALAAAPQAPRLGEDALHLLRRLLSNQHTLTGPEFRSELEKIVAEESARHAAAPQAPAAPSAMATQVIENLLQLARIVNTAVEDWGETKEDNTLHVIFHKEQADKLEEILDFLDSLPDAPPEEGVILSGPSRAARVLRAQATPAAPAVDAFTHAELLEIQRAVEEFADCNETDVDYALLLRAAQAGYLECTQFHVLNQSALDLDTVAAAQAKEGGA